MGDLEDNWQLPAMREAFGNRWDIRRVHHTEIIAVPRDGAGEPLKAMSAAVLRVLIGEAEWARITAKYRPSRRQATSAGGPARRRQPDRKSDAANREAPLT